MDVKQLIMNQEQKNLKVTKNKYLYHLKYMLTQNTF